MSLVEAGAVVAGAAVVGLVVHLFQRRGLNKKKEKDEGDDVK